MIERMLMLPLNFCRKQLVRLELPFLNLTMFKSKVEEISKIGRVLLETKKKLWKKMRKLTLYSFC